MNRSQNDIKLTIRNRTECIGKKQIQLMDLGRHQIDPKTILMNTIRTFSTIEIERLYLIYGGGRGYFSICVSKICILIDVLDKNTFT